jgi:hypothetical protein
MKRPLLWILRGILLILVIIAIALYAYIHANDNIG